MKDPPLLCGMGGRETPHKIRGSFDRPPALRVLRRLTMTAFCDGGVSARSAHTTYATANPTCAAIIIRYMWRHDGWFSVAVSSSGLRTISQTV
ncbi:MAG: hypothetical protein QOC81_405 [Thermoanaerobaculia bacterium]|nr:hypothetical protein [Thermoanaerobaculia bacterium]